MSYNNFIECLRRPIYIKVDLKTKTCVLIVLPKPGAFRDAF